MKNIIRKSSLVAIVTSSIFLTHISIAPSLADEAQALECLMEKEPKMQFVVCRSYGDRLEKKSEFTGEYSFLMMNVVFNQIRELSNDKSKSKELLKATTVAMFDIISKKNKNFILAASDYSKKLGSAAQKKFDTGLIFLEAVMNLKDT